MAKLKFDVMTKRRKSTAPGMPPGKETLSWVSDSATLIFGDRDAVVVDTFREDEAAHELVDWIDSFDRDLKAIFITRSHPDHSFGLRTLLEHYPTAQAIVSPPAGRSFSVEGRDVWSFNGNNGKTSLYIPSVDLVVAGEAIYDRTHPYMSDLDRDGRRMWLAGIDGIAGLYPKVVVVGHGPLDPDCEPKHIVATRTYIRDLEWLDHRTHTPRELYDRMLELYPDWINPGSLWATVHKLKDLRSLSQVHVKQCCNNAIFSSSMSHA
jgi:glyoxylase-like metal-dependent hydrolase (beta-lactamase superfamily II)